MKRIYFLILSILLMIGIVIVISFAWFTNTEFVEPDISGYSISSYFGGGDGSVNDPYQIKNERHLYNLAWLQYLGYFNKIGSGTTPDEDQDNPTSSTLTQYSFVITNDLDMSEWPLPPIGTSLRPFIGNLNGGNHTITNLNTTNRYQDFGTRHPSTVTNDNYTNVEIIGFIGAIGKLDETMENDEYTVSNEPTLTNITLMSNTVKSITDNVLIGSVAGYVNGLIADVGVKDATLKVSSTDVVRSIQNKVSNLSDYSVVGYAEDAYTTAKTNNNTTIYNPTTTYDHFTYYGMGNSDNWGGSLDMSSLYSRINTQINNTKLNSYVTNQIDYLNSDGTTLKESITVSGSPSSTHYAKSYGSSGSYLTQNTAPYSGYDYLTALYKDVITVKVSGTTSGYKILNPNGYYLNMTSQRVNNTVTFDTSISFDDDASTATVWIIDYDNGEYSISTYDSNDGNRYYLGTTDYTTLSLSTSNTFTWKYNSNSGYYATNNSTDYYLRFINSNWVVSNKRSYYITDGNGNYLTRSGTNVTNSTNQADATKWIFENEDTKSGIIYDESNTSYKLYTNGTTLTAPTNNQTSWSNNGSNFYNGSNNIIFNGTNWTIYKQAQFYIGYDGKYLTLNNDGSINNNVTDINSASIWTFSDVTTYPKGYISTTINGNTYYLRYNNGLTTTTSTNNRTSWSNSGDGIYYNNYYIQYKNSQWVATEAELNGYKISYTYNNTVYYLTATTTTISATTNSSNATIWKVDTNNNNYVYTIINDVYYYLYADTDDLAQISNDLNKVSQASWQNNSYGCGRKNGNTIQEGSYESWTLYYSGSSWIFANRSRDLKWANQYDSINQSLTNVLMPSESLANLHNQTITTSIGTATTYTRTSKNVPSEYNYIPLNTDTNNIVKDTNTGYLMSGGHSDNSGGLTAVDIRVAGAATSYSVSRLSTSVNSNGTIKSNKVYTYDSSGLHTINDSSNTYQKYAASRQSLETTLQAHTSAIGGIHFITSLISMNNMVTAPSVMINGDTYTNYQMPENSIDFQLKTRGYINFFATLYYPGSTTFFSLYQIKRDEDTQEILAINHIKEIYQNSNDKSQDYIYKYETADPVTNCIYSNGSNTLPSGYTKVFDTTWIETPSFATSDFEDKSNSSGYQNGGRFMKKLFYFEIPVNSGEFALGSVSGRDGGYLLYLDIGANAAAVDRTIVTQKNVTTKSDYKYVNGIQILDSNSTATTMDASNSAVAIIPASNSSIGDIVISRTDNTITFSQALNSTYLGKGITGNNLTLTALSPPTTVTENVLKYYDYNKAIDTLYVTTVTNDGTNNTGYNVYKILSDSNVLIADQNTSSTEILTKEYGLLKISSTGGGEPVDLSAVNVNTSTAEKELEYDFLVDTSDKNKIETTVEMNFEAITGNDTITNADTSINNAPASITFTNGRIVLTDDYVIEKAYKLTGDTITVTLDATTQVQIYVNVSRNYTFIINTKTATTSSTDIYTVAPSS